MTTDQIDALIAKDAIRDLVLQYCRAVDRGDVALAETLYERDALDEHGFNSSNTAREFLDSIEAMSSGLTAIQHNITNHLIRITGPDTAEGEAYLVAYHRSENEDSAYLLLIGGRYLDRYSKREGQWKIAHRKCVAEWGHEAKVPAKLGDDSITGAIAAGQMDAEDPSYAFFAEFPRGVRL